MYAAVPRMMPAAVIAGVVMVGNGGAVTGPVSAIFARPKSSTFTVPSVRTFTFAGFKSRCTMPASCAAASASAI